MHKTDAGVYAGHSTATGTLNYQGTHGNVWGSGEVSATNAYYLAYSTTYIWPQNSNNKSNGLSVRCIELM